MHYQKLKRSLEIAPASFVMLVSVCFLAAITILTCSNATGDVIAK
jgi:lipopolysaccharide/colanic/teichoic acid biosynthesis glycosyltransferase